MVPGFGIGAEAMLFLGRVLEIWEEREGRLSGGLGLGIHG